MGFQPTRPLRGATHRKVSNFGWFGISTHAPLAGRDALPADTGRGPRDFNPRAPCGARHQLDHELFPAMGISTHAPLAGRDAIPGMLLPCKMISTHAPLAGRDLDLPTESCFFPISTHAPLAGRDQ